MNRSLSLDYLLQWAVVISFVGALIWQPLFFVAIAAGVAYCVWGDRNS